MTDGGPPFVAFTWNMKLCLPELNPFESLDRFEFPTGSGLVSPRNIVSAPKIEG